jgi:hypothetical protein
MRYSLAVVPVLLLAGLVPTSAQAHDWCAMRGEYEGELAIARMMGKLDDCQLLGYVAAENQRMNQWIYAEYHRPLPGRAAGAAPASAPAVPAVAPAVVAPRPLINSP